MKRDMDLIRDLLLKIEAGQRYFEAISSEEAAILGIQPDTPLTREEAEKLEGHLNLLEGAGLVDIEARMGGGTIIVGALSWEGHDFLDSVRDSEMWKKTKDGALQAGGWTFDLLKDLAKGLAKKKIEDLTGVKL